jgi:hypothetical protein
VLDETASKVEKEKSFKDAEKRQLDQDNQKLKEQIESILFLKKQDEFLIDVLVRKQNMLQESFRDMMSFMNICDSTITHDLNKSSGRSRREDQPADQSAARARRGQNREGAPVRQREPAVHEAQL